MAYFTEDFLAFFSELKENNHKDWFDENRKRYEKVIKAPFKSFVEDMIIRVNEIDPEVQIEAKNAIFRINRDIRFSKDKTPYKTNVSAIVSRGGRKDQTSPGVYFEFSAERMRVYGGVFMTSTEQLLHVREEIADHPETFEKLIENKDFKKKYGQVLGEKAKRLPKELKEAAEKQPLIYNKQFYYFAEFPAETILQDDLADIIVDYYKTGKPIADFLSNAL